MQSSPWEALMASSLGSLLGEHLLPSWCSSKGMAGKGCPCFEELTTKVWGNLRSWRAWGPKPLPQESLLLRQYFLHILQPVSVQDNSRKFIPMCLLLFLFGIHPEGTWSSEQPLCWWSMVELNSQWCTEQKRRMERGALNLYLCLMICVTRQGRVPRVPCNLYLLLTRLFLSTVYY